MTTFLIGVDEAGYGPNLGPLVVAATVWQVEAGPCDGAVANGRPHKPSDLTSTDWYASLADRISRTADAKRVAVADSKLLYNPAAGLTLLEEGVLSAVGTCRSSPTSWSSLVELLNADQDGAGRCLPWHQAWDTKLPIAACPDRIRQLSPCFRRSPAAVERPRRTAQIALGGVEACIVHPARFNQLTAEADSKATALSRISLALLARVLARLHAARNGTPVNAIAVCDKHGGRDHYAPLLMEAFCDTLVHVGQESRAFSRYRLRTGSMDADVSFRRKGEAFMPTALASMTAKYVRELAMRAFNDFWCARVEGLRPTAGYPVDAKRFRRDIADVQSQLGIDDTILWRTR